jgi:hypothetical protein
MAEPIRIKILVYKRGSRDPRLDSVGGYTRAPESEKELRWTTDYDVVEMVEATPPKTCTTCKHRVRESDYDEFRDQHMSWHECHYDGTEEFDEMVNDGTGFCHRHEEKKDG